MISELEQAAILREVRRIVAAEKIRLNRVRSQVMSQREADRLFERDMADLADLLKEAG